jgi:LysM repeat protein
MKVLDIIEDITRRGLLKGAGAMATGIGSAQANVITARQGDTVYSIGREYNVSPTDLFKLNGMDNTTKLVPGQRLKLPANAKPVTPVDAPDEIETLIKQKLGDEERKNLVALFTQDLPPEKSTTAPVNIATPKATELSPMPGIDTRTTGPGTNARATAKPDQHIKPIQTSKPVQTVKPAAPTKPVRDIPTAAGAVPKEEIRNYLLSKGMDIQHAVGMMVNMFHESSFKPSNYNPNDRGGPSGGLCQWHDNHKLGYHRFTDMVRAVPDWKSNWKAQIDFAFTEPEGRRFLSTHFTTPEAASIAWTNIFERPADAGATANKRANSPMMRQLASNT